jgi:VanZ family protein
MKFFKLWLPVILWAGLIFGLSAVPNLKTGLEDDFLVRKSAHVGEYFILSLLLHRAVKNSFSLKNTHLFFYPAGLALFYAASDEFHQLFVHGRNGALTDVLIDCIGILGFYVCLKYFPFKRRPD